MNRSTVKDTLEGQLRRAQHHLARSDCTHQDAEIQQKKIKRLQEAMHRLKIGTYGKCAVCGDKISSDRLQRYPDLVTCVICAGREAKNAH